MPKVREIDHAAPLSVRNRQWWAIFNRVSLCGLSRRVHKVKTKAITQLRRAGIDCAEFQYTYTHEIPMRDIRARQRLLSGV